MNIIIKILPVFFLLYAPVKGTEVATHQSADMPTRKSLSILKRPSSENNDREENKRAKSDPLSVNGASEDADGDTSAWKENEETKRINEFLDEEERIEKGKDEGDGSVLE